jgi:hypothetical protein
LLFVKLIFFITVCGFSTSFPGGFMFKSPCFLFVLLLSVSVFSQAEVAQTPVSTLAAQNQAQPAAKTIGTAEKTIDSCLAVFKSHLLGILPENATKAVLNFNLSGSARIKITTFDTATEKSYVADSTLKMDISGNIVSMYTKSGEKKKDTIKSANVDIDKTAVKKGAAAGAAKQPVK